MNFRSIAQLSDQLLYWSRELPAEIEVVAGVPRSGLLVANLLALYKNLPLTDVDGLLEGRCFASGTRRRDLAEVNGRMTDDRFLDRPRTVLVLDDSLLSGRSMQQVRERIEAAGLPHRILYGAVYVAPEQSGAVDVCCEVVNTPRVFEWNVLHGGILHSFCVSLDGVLCRAPASRELDDDARFTDFIAGVKPFVVPSTEIGWIIADRPESARSATEAWLRTHGYMYRNLVMLDLQRDASQRPAGLTSTCKADVYNSTDATLMIEDSFRESVEIAKLTGRHVLCTGTMQLVHPGTIPLSRTDMPLEMHPPVQPTISDRLTRLTKAAARQLLPEAVQDAIRRHRFPAR
jgi:orotate phosphoribosyltransferase